MNAHQQKSLVVQGPELYLLGNRNKRRKKCQYLVSLLTKPQPSLLLLVKKWLVNLRLKRSDSLYRTLSADSLNFQRRQTAHFTPPISQLSAMKHHAAAAVHYDYARRFFLAHPEIWAMKQESNNNNKNICIAKSICEITRKYYLIEQFACHN